MQAIKQEPILEGTSDLKSFLGMINYYAKFLPNLSTQLAPIFGQAATKGHQLELEIASAEGFCRSPKNCWPRPEQLIAFASRSLSLAEGKYAQLDREDLAIIFGVKQFH